MKQTVADFHFLHSGYAQTKVTVCDSEDLRDLFLNCGYLIFCLCLIGRGWGSILLCYL